MENTVEGVPSEPEQTTGKGRKGFVPVYARPVADMGILQNRRPRRLSDWAKYLSNARTVIFNIILLVLSCAFLIMLYKDVRKTAITIHPVPVPETLSKRGYTPDVAAAHIAAELQRIDKETTTTRSRQRIVEDRTEIEFQLPGQLFSFRTLVRFFRALLYIQNTEVAIHVTDDVNGYVALIRVSGGAYNGAVRRAVSRVTTNAEDFFVEVGRKTMRAVQPHVLTSYHSNREYARCVNESVCDYRESLSILNELIADPSGPDYTWALLGHGWIMNQLNRREEAIASYRKVTESDPKSALAYSNWGAALSDLGGKKEALEKHKKAVELDPKYALAYTNWGNTLRGLGRHEEAIEKYKDAVTVDPKDTWAYFNWANVLRDLGRKEEAIDIYKKAITIDPKYADAYYSCAVTLSDLGRHEEAIEKYETAIQINPRYGDAYRNWASTLEKLGKVKEAAEKRKIAAKLRN